MTERSEIRTAGSLLLERLAWNAAAVAALAVMILVLLASIEWLDRLGIGTPPVAARAAVDAAEAEPVQRQAKAERPRAAKWP
ncbi:MAG: hypothetical protein U0900_16095 [Myxococcota bacterium]